jgi:hypothetical protein
VLQLEHLVAVLDVCYHYLIRVDLAVKGFVVGLQHIFLTFKAVDLQELAIRESPKCSDLLVESLVRLI